ncbi:hypothetical protein GGR50DRAFT_686212 [Xylaria sp. CBS 124048]|nr:hypothetical protein GGR50DRAFT_686212 [Xylaria sp. CBS 124048]
MSAHRIALKAIVETCVGQAAWIWVSGYRRGNTIAEAKLGDFKMFDDASRGLYGADLPVSCETANCTWPIFPSLAVCGACMESSFSSSCDPQTGGCIYSMPSGMSIVSSSSSAPFEYRFRVAPSIDAWNVSGASSEAMISVFDTMSSAKTPRNTAVRAHQCGLWFCLQSYNVSVTNGVVSKVVTATWSKAELAPESSAHFEEYVFEDIPTEMNAKEHARYSVSMDALRPLKVFVDKLTRGNASQVAGIVSYDTDWIQAIEAASKDLNGWISRLARSLTNHVQLTGTVRPNANDAYAGTAYIMASHVEVNWYWVAYPVSLMILAFLYLLQTTNSLPMLFCHVSRGIHAQVADGMDVPGGLNYRVGRMEVELVRNDSGQWIFTEPGKYRGGIPLGILPSS